MSVVSYDLQINGIWQDLLRNIKYIEKEEILFILVTKFTFLLFAVSVSMTKKNFALKDLYKIAFSYILNTLASL